MTLSAWKLSVTSDEGDGAITLAELSSGQVLYRGDGVCLGWPQDRLAAAYEALVPRDQAAAPEMPQLG